MLNYNQLERRLRMKNIIFQQCQTVVDNTLYPISNISNILAILYVSKWFKSIGVVYRGKGIAWIVLVITKKTTRWTTIDSKWSSFFLFYKKYKKSEKSIWHGRGIFANINGRQGRADLIKESLKKKLAKPTKLW